MSAYFRIPRVYLPVDDEVYPKWAVPSCFSRPYDRTFWMRVLYEVGNSPSLAYLMMPLSCLDGADGEKFKEIQENRYLAVEDGVIKKLNRGCVFVQRVLSSGETRCGLLINIDLEYFGEGVQAVFHPTDEVDREEMMQYQRLRKMSPLEFPSACVFYKDKKHKVNKLLLGCDLEQLYDFELSLKGGFVTGFFVPEELAVELIHLLNPKEDAHFAVADGNLSLAASKALWEEIKGKLSEKERVNHPARFAMVELCNLLDDEVCLQPLHRVITDVESDVFCDYFMRHIKCKRQGNELVCARSSRAEELFAIDKVISDYRKANGGELFYMQKGKSLSMKREQDDCVVVKVEAIDKEEMFDRVKMGKSLPKKSFAFSQENEKRYHLEGREISYD